LSVERRSQRATDARQSVIAHENAVAALQTEKTDTPCLSSALFVGSDSTDQNTKQNQHVAQESVVRVYAVKERLPVYDLQVEGCHEFFAGGILVHNCVWALTELGVETSPGDNIEEYYKQKKALEAAKARG